MPEKCAEVSKIVEELRQIDFICHELKVVLIQLKSKITEILTK